MSRETHFDRYREILNFWFGPRSGTELWFGGGEAVDAEIRERFGRDLEDAVDYRLASWEAFPESMVALVVLLDQFSLQLFRDQRKGYEQCALALPIAERAIAKSFDRQVPFARRAFLYMPFMHAEDLKLQDRGVEYFTKLAAECAPADRAMADNFLKFAKIHRDVVKKYGRFPGRNECFDRKNTPEEQRYLDGGGEF